MYLRARVRVRVRLCSSDVLLYLIRLADKCHIGVSSFACIAVLCFFLSQLALHPSEMLIDSNSKGPCSTNLSAAVEEKLAKNAAKYPAALVKGSSKKYDQYTACQAAGSSTLEN